MIQVGATEEEECGAMWFNLKHYPSIFPNELRKTTTNFNYYNRSGPIFEPKTLRVRSGSTGHLTVNFGPAFRIQEGIEKSVETSNSPTLI
jgi:hypothetical protein